MSRFISLSTFVIIYKKRSHIHHGPDSLLLIYTINHLKSDKKTKCFF